MKLSSLDIVTILAAIKNGEKQSVVARRYGISAGYICQLVAGLRRKHVAIEAAAAPTLAPHPLWNSKFLEDMRVRAEEEHLVVLATELRITLAELRELALNDVAMRKQAAELRLQRMTAA